MSEKKLNFGAFIGGLVLVIAGVLILCKQDAFIKIVIVCASVAALVDGIYTLIEYRQWNFASLTNKLTLIKGIVMTASGVIGIIMPLFAAQAVVTVVVYVFGAMLVYSAFVSIQDAVVLKRLNPAIPREHFYVEAVFSIIIAVIFFTDPTKVLSALVVIVGIAAILVGLGFVLFAFLTKNN